MATVFLNHTFDSYQPMQPGQVGGRRQGVLVSMEAGKASSYGIMGVEDRGTIFLWSRVRKCMKV
ncbi:hypothetical protein GCM10020331_044830 [Ectobacillus funiculus]